MKVGQSGIRGRGLSPRPSAAGGGRKTTELDVKNLHAVVLCLCVLRGVCVRLGGSQGLLALHVGLQQRRLLQRQLFTRVRPVLDVYDPVVGLESPPQVDVDLALDVHEHQSACEADGHHHQLGPEGPLQDAWGERRGASEILAERRKLTAQHLSHERTVDDLCSGVSSAVQRFVCVWGRLLLPFRRPRPLIASHFAPK